MTHHSSAAPDAALISDLGRPLTAADARGLVGTLGEVLDGLEMALAVFDQDDRVLFWNRMLFKLFPEHEGHMREGESYADNLRRFYSARLNEQELPNIEDYIQAGIARHRAQVRPFEFEHRGKLIKVSSLPWAERGRIRVWKLARFQAQPDVLPAAQPGAFQLADEKKPILDNLPDGLMICGPDLRIQWVNETLAQMYGLADRNSAQGGTIESIYRTAWRQREGESEAFEQGLKVLSEYLRFAGAPFELPLPGERYTRVITQPSGGEQAFFAHVDITEIKRQQNQLSRLNRQLSQSMEKAQEASRIKSRFLANMSHEIRTPMNAIVGLLDLLHRTDLDEVQSDTINKAKEATRSLLTLVDDILDLSKVEAGKMTLDPQPFLLDQLLRNLSVILSSSVGNKPLDVLFDVAPTLPGALVGDQQRLHQVLVNLMANAIKFTSSGVVVLHVRQRALDASAATLEFVVEDSGIGIAPEHQERIFDGFNQAETSTTRRFGGTGLGLSISQKLVQLMGGHIVLTSELGVGSRFSFVLTFPLADPLATLNEAGHGAGRSGRALLVDDCPEAAALIAGILARQGWQVEHAKTEQDALALIDASLNLRHDVALVDSRLSGGDGWELALRIRQAAEARTGLAPRIVVVGVQQRDDPASRTAQERAAVQSFLVRPFTSAMLMDSVKLALSDVPLGRVVTRGPERRRRLAGMNVLVVEDNLINQHIAEGLLGSEGAQVSLAANGELGVQAVAAASPPYDVVLMDLQMPVMDGLAATRVIRRELGLTQLPIVAMTANAMSTDRAECLAAGMNQHVGKPFKVDELVSLLLRLTGRG